MPQTSFFRSNKSLGLQSSFKQVHTATSYVLLVMMVFNTICGNLSGVLAQEEIIPTTETQDIKTDNTPPSVDSFAGVPVVDDTNTVESQKSTPTYSDQAVESDTTTGSTAEDAITTTGSGDSVDIATVPNDTGSVIFNIATDPESVVVTGEQSQSTTGTENPSLELPNNQEAGT